MILLHYKSGTLKTKLLIFFLLFGVAAGSTILILSSFLLNKLFYYGVGIELFFLLMLFLEWIWAKFIIDRLTNNEKGLKNKKNNELRFMNIEFEREVFTKDEFKEYYEYYFNFYKSIKRIKW